ncbi:glycosyltransferase family 4 protein [Bacteroidota bacterium]
MKIALIHYRLIRKGGLETRLLNYIDQFVSLGHHVSVICVKYDPAIPIPDHVEIVQLKLGLVINPFRKWYFNVRLGKIMKENSYDFSLSMGRTSHQDAVLAPSNHLGYMQALGQSCKGIRDYLQIYLDKQSYIKSKLIFAASQMMKEQLVNLYGIDSSKIKILFPPLDTSRFSNTLKQQSLRLKEKFGIDSKKKTFVFASTNLHLKGIGLLADVFSKLDSTLYELIVTGNLPAGKSYENIRFLGYVTNIQELYAASDYLIHPSKFDGFGQIISEALQCGIPVIISENTGAKVIISDKLGIVVKGFDADSWRNAILNLDKMSFQIPDNFAEEYGLSIQQHVEKMLLLREEAKRN